MIVCIVMLLEMKSVDGISAGDDDNIIDDNGEGGGDKDIEKNHKY